MPLLEALARGLAGEKLAQLPQLGSIFATTFVLYWVVLVIYRIWLHPLAKLPGPKLLAATGMPFLYENSISGTFSARLKKLHRKYGPVVRVAPNHLSVDGSVAWPEVFMHKPGKIEFPKIGRNFGHEWEKSLIAAPTREAHRRQRRALAHAFSEAAMYEQEPIIGFYVDLFIRRLSENASKPVDMARWLNYVTFDVIGDLTIGEPFGSLESSDYHVWIHNVFNGVRGLVMARFLAGAGPLFAPLALLYPPVRKALDAYRQTTEYSQTKALARIDLGPEPPLRTKAGAAAADGGGLKMQVRRDFFTYMMRKNRDNEDGLTRDEMRVNSYTLITGGSETTATNLSTLFFELARLRNRHYRDAVMAEVRGFFKRESDVTLRSVQGNCLLLLHACIEESLRIHPPTAEVPERVSPGAFVNGQYVAPGTIISVFQTVTYANPDHFLEPEDFRPERFLPANHPLYDGRFKAYDNMAVFKPFSAGPRDCIGKNLAYSEMRLVAARVLLRFDIELAEGTSDSWLDDQRVFVIWEKTPLMIKLTERTDLELKSS